MSRAVVPANTYTDRLLKLIPAEMVGGHVAIVNLVKDDSTRLQWFALGSALILLLLLPLYLRHTGVTSWRQVGITMISFVVWVYSLGDGFRPGPVFERHLYDSQFATAVIIVWTIAAPLLGRAQEDTSPGG